MLNSVFTGLIASLAIFGVSIIGVSAQTIIVPEISGFGKGTLQRNFSVSGVPLLKSFFFNFGSGEDHHIQHVSVYPETNGKITLAFEDNDGNDEFFYNIEYEATAAPGTAIGSTSDVCRGTCPPKAISGPSPASDYVFVLRGFRIYYTGDDHHIDEVALYESNGQLNVRFNDKNNDDFFTWYARWAWVPRDRFTTVGTVSGYSCDTDDTCFSDSKSVPAGHAVIRGFRFDFTQSDHHLGQLGVFTRNNGVIEAYFGDKNGDDEFYWFAQYAVLAPTIIVGPIDPTP
jgi:hypothetical protein